MISGFFIARPKFAFVVAIVIVLVGLLAAVRLPIEQLPEITPPVVQVTASYPGADGLTVEATVAQPIEQQVNGVSDMIYMSSQSANDGTYALQVTFEVGTDPDIAQVNVQNRVALALARLPEDVSRRGISVQKRSTNLLLVINILSPDGTYDDLFLSNFTSINLIDSLTRLPGVGEAVNFGARDYGMRLWLDVRRMASLGLSSQDVIAAVQEQNINVAPGRLGTPPVDPDQQFEYTLRTQGRLADADAFRRIIIRANPDGSFVRIGDIARVELGAESYGSYGELDGVLSTNVGIFQLPGSNALEVARSVEREMERLSARFPPDLEYRILYDTTRFVDEALKEVAKTLFIVVVVVVLVVFVFLQDWRMTLVPAVTIPVSLIGTFFALSTLGFSINTITMLGLVLAIGIVVDDAIIVVENVQRRLQEGLGPKEATTAAMKEVTGPIIATTLVLLAVFVSVGFIPGITGQLYQQFALTIAVAVAISTINALTLSPALCATFVRPHVEQPGLLFRAFNWGFERLRNGYGRAVHTLVRRVVLMLGVASVLAGLTTVGFLRLPTAFLPEEDQGYFFVSVQLPSAASLSRTRAALDNVGAILKETPGIRHTVTIGGYNFLTGAASSNAGVIFAVLDPWYERRAPELHVDAILARVRGPLFALPEALVFAFNPPAIPGLGTVGGFDFRLQDTVARDPQDLAAALRALILAANESPTLTNVFSTFEADVPQVWVEIDRERAKIKGVSLTEIFTTLQSQLGSYYINDFNKFGRVFRVLMEAEEGFRRRPDDVLNLYARNQGGEMVPLRSLARVQPVLGPESISRYNLFRAAQINGEPAPGFSSGDAIAAMEQLAARVLPGGMTYEWSGATLQELRAGQTAPILFALAILFAYLFLVAQYESWSVPLAIILSVPLAALGAVVGLMVVGIPNDIYGQLGIVLLIGLAAKNAILIVEFAKVRHEAGVPLLEAAETAARLRFRAILMTSLAFILGVIPLLIATGAGAASRLSLGTTVFSGMLAAVLVGALLVPVFYVATQRTVERLRAPADRPAAPAPADDGG